MKNSDSHRPSKGLFITFEGGEGSGKTTLLQRLDTALRESGLAVVRTREPGGSPLGEHVRDLLLHQHYPISTYAELMLFLAARAQHVSEFIKPAIGSHKIVLCDRFNDSTTAYQAYARGLDKETVQKFCDFVCQGLEPNLTFFLDIDPVEGMQRTKRRGEKVDRIESEKMEFHQKVRFGMQELAKKFPKRIVVLDAHQPAEEVFKQAWKHLNALIDA